MESNHFLTLCDRPAYPTLFQYFKNFSFFCVLFSLLMCLIPPGLFESNIPYFSLVENKGVEPLTLCVQGRCSSQLS